MTPEVDPPPMPAMTLTVPRGPTRSASMRTMTPPSWRRRRVAGQEDRLDRERADRSCRERLSSRHAIEARGRDAAGDARQEPDVSPMATGSPKVRSRAPVVVGSPRAGDEAERALAARDEDALLRACRRASPRKTAPASLTAGGPSSPNLPPARLSRRAALDRRPRAGRRVRPSRGRRSPLARATSARSAIARTAGPSTGRAERS